MQLLTRLSERVGAEVNRRQLLRLLTSSGAALVASTIVPGVARAAGANPFVVEAGSGRSYRMRTGSGVVPDHCCPLYDCQLYRCKGCPAGCDMYRCTDVCSGEVHFECDCRCPYGACNCHYSYC